METITCRRCGRDDAPVQERAPFKNELGERLRRGSLGGDSGPPPGNSEQASDEPGRPASDFCRSLEIWVGSGGGERLLDVLRIP